LVDICQQRGLNALIGDCLNLPLRCNSADGVISIAVIHHFSTKLRRLKALGEISRVLKVGGKALIYAWARDQRREEKKSTYLAYGNGKEAGKDASLGSFSLPVHENRTEFKHADVLVPWKKKGEDSTYHRFYHVFEEGELEELIDEVRELSIERSYYDEGNWCAIVIKVS